MKIKLLRDAPVKPANKAKKHDLNHPFTIGIFSNEMGTKIYLLLLLVLGSLSFPSLVTAQKNENERKTKYVDTIFKDYIKSVELHQIGWKFSPPIIALNSGDLLQLDFDDLAGDYVQYGYTLVHCDADWMPSDMVAFDYLKGFSTDQITDYAFSFNTFQKYTHYRLVLPNANMQVLLSGNYILKVFKDNNPDSLIFTHKVMVYENGISIAGKEKRGMGGDLFTKQEIIFTINGQKANITDPFHALQIFISQNGRWDNAIIGIQPSYVQGSSIIYDLDEGNSFDGGNEFRSFDMTSLRYLTMNEAAFVDNKTSTEIQLKADENRGGLQYYTFDDINGQFLIQDKDDDSTPINSQYVYVDFYLPMDSEITTGNIYIFGALSNWKCDPDLQMHYEKFKHGYIGTAYLKQGYYEYQYAYLKKGSSYADCTLIEGNHFETTNTYYIYAYYRQVGLFYDKLIGFTTVHAPGN